MLYLAYAFNKEAVPLRTLSVLMAGMENEPSLDRASMATASVGPVGAATVPAALKARMVRTEESILMKPGERQRL